MELKLFEVRDRHTFIAVVAIKIYPSVEAERFLMARSGFGPTPIDQSKYLFLSCLGDGRTTLAHDHYEWGNNRTMFSAHKYISENWYGLESGAVVDVEFILGETKEPKQSERYDSNGI